jgi:membrane protease YdiL (CAAX protease family)
MTAVAPDATGQSKLLQPALPSRAIVSILIIIVGYGGVGSAVRLLRESTGQLSGFDITVKNGNLLTMLLFELVVGASLVLYLRRSGWRLEQLTLPPAGRDPLRAVGLWLAALVSAWAVIVLALFAAALLGAPTHAPPIQPIRFVGHLHWTMVAAASLVNPVFEEFLWLGFVAAAFRAAGAWRIAVLSVGLRVLVHTYQGVFAILFIAPVGAVFVTYYLRTRRIWPVVLAHAIQDAIGLGWLAATGGHG